MSASARCGTRALVVSAVHAFAQAAPASVRRAADVATWPARSSPMPPAHARQVVQLYGAARIHPAYGTPRPAKFAAPSDMQSDALPATPPTVGARDRTRRAVAKVRPNGRKTALETNLKPIQS